MPLTSTEPIIPGDCIAPRPLLGRPAPLVFSLPSRCMLMLVITWMAVGCSLIRQARCFFLDATAAFCGVPSRLRREKPTRCDGVLEAVSGSRSVWNLHLSTSYGLPPLFLMWIMCLSSVTSLSLSEQWNTI